MPKRAANFDGSSQAAKKVLQAGKKYAKQEVFIHNDDKLQKLLRSLVHAAKAFPIEAVGLIVRAVTSGQKVYEQNLSQCFCAIGQVLKSAESLASFVAILDAYVEVKSSIDPEEVLEEDGQMFEAAAVIFCDMLEAGVADMNDKTMQAAMSVFRTQQCNPCLYELLVEKAQEKFPGGVFAPWPPSDNFVVWFGGEPTKDSAALSMMFAKKQMEVWMAKSWSSASTLRLVNGQVVDLLGKPVQWCCHGTLSLITDCVCRALSLGRPIWLARGLRTVQKALWGMCDCRAQCGAFPKSVTRWIFPFTKALLIMAAIHRSDSLEAVVSNASIWDTQRLVPESRRGKGSGRGWCRGRSQHRIGFAVPM